MELWQILIIVGIILLIIYFYRGNKFSNILYNNEKFKYYNNNNIIDLDVYINSILLKIMDKNNYPYPIQFNPSLAPIKVLDITNNSKQITSIIKYLEDRFNSYDKNYILSIINIKQLIETSTEKQVKYNILLETNINVIDNKIINKHKKDIIMEIIISKYFENDKINYEMYITKLVLDHLAHSAHIKGIEKDLERKFIQPDIPLMPEKDILNDKIRHNLEEMQGLNSKINNSDYIYNTEDMIIETLIPNKSYSNYDNNSVTTEDVLDIFQ
jgi:hypothetical protein